MEDMYSQSTNPSQQGNPFPQIQMNLPNSTTVLVLGIISIVCSFWFFALIGIILGIIAIVLGNKDITLYYSNRNFYTLSSFNNVKAGRVCAIIGLVIALINFFLGLLLIIGLVASFPFFGMIN
ncbi:MAG: CCC motif membrane protein [Bacteroidota bacterium]|nr:CCC motif membrane protein [Bacteroidota bacterium]